MIKAVLFDFDGTLIDTNKLIFDSYRYAFRMVLKREIDDTEILTIYGRPLRESLLEYGEPGDMLYKVYREYNETRHDDLAQAFPGACNGVKRIKNMGIKTGIVTSKRLELVQRGIDLIGLSGFFDVIVTPEDTAKTKPHPEPVLLGCQKLGVLPEETIYVGDSLFDLEAGKGAGTRLCAVSYTLTPLEKILAYKPAFFVDSIVQLADEIRRVM